MHFVVQVNSIQLPVAIGWGMVSEKNGVFATSGEYC